jgi:hypothetical protein
MSGPLMLENRHGEHLPYKLLHANSRSESLQAPSYNPSVLSLSESSREVGPAAPWNISWQEKETMRLVESKTLLRVVFIGVC